MLIIIWSCRPTLATREVWQTCWTLRDSKPHWNNWEWKGWCCGKGRLLSTNYLLQIFLYRLLS